MAETKIPRWLRAPPSTTKKVAAVRVPMPEARGGVMWQRMYEAALKSNHPQPEKMADTMLRSREEALKLRDARHKTLVTTAPPKPQEAAATIAPKKGRAVLSDACRCKALTLEGRRCGFKATCGDFCSKHKVAR